PSSAARAAETAASTSSGPPSGISAHGSPGEGFCDWDVLPDQAPTALPPTSIENRSSSAIPSSSTSTGSTLGVGRAGHNGNAGRIEGAQNAAKRRNTPL